MKNHKKGFSIFVAVAVAGALLVVAFMVSRISIKSLEFANIGKQSQIAFFAADAGMECALYWEAQDVSKFDISISGSPINCAGASISSGSAISGTSSTARIGGGGTSAEGRMSRFGFILNQGGGSPTPCAIVLVYKHASGSTTISSFGYNTCTDDSRRVERGIDVTY